MDYLEHLTNILISIYSSNAGLHKQRNKPINEDAIISRMRNVARFMIYRESYRSAPTDTQLSKSYSDLKDKHCLLKLEFCNLKTDYRKLRYKREAACNQAAIYHRKYEEAANYLANNNPLKNASVRLDALLDLSSI